jgi:hypothetical protein
MTHTDQPFETEHHDMTGNASLDLVNRGEFYAFLAKHANYDPDRFDPVALKIFMEGRDFILTLYALDKSKQEQESSPKDKLPVKKFKLAVSWYELFTFVKRFDIVVSEGNYDIKDMVVINK